MCQPTTTITAKVAELMNLKKLVEELQNQMEAITDEIKAFMGSEETMMPRRLVMHITEAH